MVRSYNGWAASTSASAIGVNTSWEPIKGHRFPGGVKSGDVETVMTYLVRQLDARVEPIELYSPGDEWGWAFRLNRNNPDTLSCHASATAIDYNATRHPNRRKYTWTRAQTREIHKILDELGGVIKWLEGFDEMHFEVRGTPAQVRAVAQRLRTPSKPPVRPPAIEDDTMFIMKATGQPTRFVDPPVAVPIGEATRKNLLARGVKEFTFTAAEVKAVISQVVKALD